MQGGKSCCGGADNAVASGRSCVGGPAGWHATQLNRVGCPTAGSIPQRCALDRWCLEKSEVPQFSKSSKAASTTQVRLAAARMVPVSQPLAFSNYCLGASCCSNPSCLFQLFASQAASPSATQAVFLGAKTGCLLGILPSMQACLSCAVAAYTLHARQGIAFP